MPLYAADLGISGLSDVGVQELADDKSEVVARTQTGVTELGSTGIYYRNWTPNSSTALLYWNSTGTASAYAVGSVIDESIDAILVDTGTTIPGVLGTPAGADLATDIATVDTVVDGIQTDLDNGTDGLGAIKTQVAAIETDTQDIQGRLPASLSSGNIKADVLAISTSTAAADNLEASASTIIVDTIAVGATETTTTFKGGGTASLDATDDHYNGRIIIFTSGALQNQATDITDYTGSTNVFTVTALTEAPSDGDSFVIV